MIGKRRIGRYQLSDLCCTYSLVQLLTVSDGLVTVGDGRVSECMHFLGD